MSTVRYAVLSGTVRYGTECVNIRTVLSLIFMLLIRIFYKNFINFWVFLSVLKKIVSLWWYGPVRLVRRTEEEKYDTYIWAVLLLPIRNVMIRM